MNNTTRNPYLYEERPFERSRLPPLARMLTTVGTGLEKKQNSLTWRQKYNRWMINEGSRHITLLIFALLHAMVFVFGIINYQLKDTLAGPRAIFGFTYPIARASALVLHVDVALLLFPVCRTLISLLRQTPLNGIIQFDQNISFHKMTAWSIVFFSWLHTIAHWNNFAQLAIKQGLGFKGFILANFATGPGWTGYVMLIALMAIVWTSVDKVRKRNFERFWYTHHLFIVFFGFWAVHGVWCMIPSGFQNRCRSFGANATGVFWQYWQYGAFIYLLERIMREVRGRHSTYISKVVQHPGNVVEIQIKKEHTKYRAGMYVFISCPEVSLWQYHPFTLTSAPEEDYISVHVSMKEEKSWTRRLGEAVGCEVDTREKRKFEGAQMVAVGPDQMLEVGPALRRVLPRVHIDGPFGSASEDVFKYETAILVGGGIGVTPFASILKSIWYRLNYPASPKGYKQTRLRKVYFFWVCRDINAFEWFQSLLLAIEAQDLDQRIEIHTYLTGKVHKDQLENINLNDDGEKDTITGLTAPTRFGRPEWEKVFAGVRKLHRPGAW